MIVAVADLIPKKLRTMRLSIPLYEGSLDDGKLSLALRETRHLEPAFIPRSLVAFLNMVAQLESEDQLLILRLMMDVTHGREVKHIELDGETFIYFPDPRGDPEYDEYLTISHGPKKQKAGAKARPTTTKTKAKI